jgi:hypothetical protein
VFPRAPRLTLNALLGAAVLLVATLLRLPSPLALFHRPQTPFDRSSPRLVPAFALLTEARALLPKGVSVTVTSEPPDPALDIDIHHMGVALLPGRLVIPAALSGTSRPDLARRADYVVVVGAVPATPPGDRLLTRPEGTIWRRRPA